MNQIQDHLDISNLLAEYCIALDIEDVDAWVDLFLPDATFETYGHTFRGHEGLRRMLTGAPRGLHLGGPPVVHLAGDTARTKQNLFFRSSESDEARGAVYNDTLRRTPEGWRFVSRRCQFITADGLRDKP